MRKFLVPLTAAALLFVQTTDLSARRDPAAEITQASVLAHLEFLASDALGGRGSGTRDEWIAATYIASQLRRWGLEPLGDNGGFVQQVDIERVEASAAPVLQAGTLRFTHGNEILVASLGGATVTGPLHHQRANTPTPAGAFVLMVPSTPGAPPSGPPPQGAAAVMTTETPQIRTMWGQMAERIPSVSARLTSVPAAPSAAPMRIVLSTAVADALAKLPDGTPVTVSAPLAPARTTHTWNVIGQLTGRDSKRRSEVILLSAHLDHLGTRPAAANAPQADTIFNGADDDASGSVAVLELAQALAAGKRPKRTVMFVWFGSEEAGGWGARHFLQAPPVPLDRIVANLEFEMIGRPDPAVQAKTLWLTGFERSNLGPELARRGARLVQDPHPEERFFERSDNIQLARRGVIAQTVSSYGLHKEYHQPSDEVGKVDLPHMTDAIRSMFDPIRWLANSEFTPQWKEGMKP